MKNLHKQLHKKYLILPWKKKKRLMFQTLKMKKIEKESEKDFSPPKERESVSHI